MRKIAAGFLGIVVTAFLVVSSGGLARAQVAPGPTATNVQDGDNRSNTNQSGSGKSGAAITGQVTGVVSSGRTSVDATNNSSNSTAQSGDVNGSNHATSFTGQDLSGITSTGTATTSTTVSNNQTGDNTSTISQSSSAVTGDGVAGQVIGAVTSGGSSSIVASNNSTNVDVITGDANATNDANAFVGQDASGISNFDSATGCVVACTVFGGATATVTAANNQTGNNRGRLSQSASTTTGDGVAGQVIGAVTSGGASSIDATNRSDNVSVTTGDGESVNSAISFVGQNLTGVANTLTALGCFADCFGSFTVTAVVNVANNQTGDNRGTVGQRANSVTGDGVGGQVIGAVTSGGSSSIVASNSTTNSDITTGDAHSTNDQTSIVGQSLSGVSNFDSATGCVVGCDFTVTATTFVNAGNTQTGNNRGTSTQSANSTTGDGVGGQVIGAVTSGGASSIDATNRTDNVDVTSGDSRSTNSGDTFVGQNLTGVSNRLVATGCEFDCTVTATIASTSTVSNTQDGDNRGMASQSANATSGDAVGGEVIGAVTSGGSSSIVAANTTTNSDITSGDANSTNDQTLVVGQDASGITNADSATGCVAFCTITAVQSSVATVANNQTGDNRGTSNQAANATSGDGVGGQVIGAVTSGGASSIDARNLTDNVSVTTGDANASNDPTMFVGQRATGVTNTASAFGCIGAINPSVPCVDTVTVVSTSTVTNTQDGNNTGSSSQNANASSGDGVGGEVIGAVTSGGSSSIVAANTTRNSDITTGDANASNHADITVGQDASGITNADSVTGCEAFCTVTAVVNSAATVANNQTGDNRGRSTQAANASTGDGVGGQVIGAVTSGGASSIDARNLTEDSSVTSGDANASNDPTMRVGQNASGVANTVAIQGCLAFCVETLTAAVNADVSNTQVGDNRGTASQSANASSGDGVGGQVIGAVTSGGASSIVADNTTRRTDVTTGDADSSNSGTIAVGQNASAVSNDLSILGCFETCTVTATVTAVSAVANDQTGDNRGRLSQASNASTGDGVGGSVIGAVTSGGASSIDARNLTEDSSVTTGNADSHNSGTIAVGQNLSGIANIDSVTGCLAECAATITVATAATVGNTQEGDNTGTLSQASNAGTGDGVGGQVIGAVTSGGSSSIVAANTTRTTDVTTGDADSSNSATLFAGQNIDGITNFATASACPTGLCASAVTATAVAVLSNNQTGNNRGTVSQAANASTGDGVGGQVIGAVTSAGASSIDASNRTEDTTVTTGDSNASNSAGAFVGLQLGSVTNVATATFGGASAATATASNLQVGNNRRTTNQAANASSGDAVGGQVTGAVTSGGATSVVVANTTTGGNFESGQSNETNSDISFVGLLALPVITP